MAHISIKKYSQVSVSNINEMSPYEQINLIFSNIIGRLAATKGFIERKEFEKKGENKIHLIISQESENGLIKKLSEDIDVKENERRTKGKIIEQNLEIINL